MSKKSKKKTQAGQTSASKFYSALAAHKLERGKLRTPLNRMEQMSQSSWLNDHLPLMLWTALLGEVLPRNEFLGCLREILNKCAAWFAKGGPLEAVDKLPPGDGSIDFTSILDMQTLAQMPDNLFNEFVQIPLRHPLGCVALRPLLLLDTIPANLRWRAVLGTEPQESDWNTLALSVAATLDHQSQRSTDIRWFKMMTPLIAGKMHYPNEMAEQLQEFLQYPNRGDQRSVRPSIRASEMMLRRSPVPQWVGQFWAECAMQTQCVDPTDFDAQHRSSTTLTPVNVLGARDSVIARFFANQTDTQVDARLDAAFGLVLYGLTIVQEIAIANMHEDVLGRIALRSLVEDAITLNYLAYKDDAQVWKTWRVYGAGQAKLAFLRIQELANEIPKFYEPEALEQIANEDQWQEFLDIDIGHWERTNLRTLAKESGCMHLYESFYAWTSSFSHSHWGSVRDTNFVTCHNPLHRMHRIPRLTPRKSSSVEADAVKLVNDMFAVLERLFPQGKPLQRLETEHDESAPSGSGS